MNCPKCGGEVLNDRCMQCGETVEPQPQEPELTLEPPVEPEQVAPQQAEPQQEQPQPPSYQNYQQSYQQPPQQDPQGGYQQQGYQPPPAAPVKHPKSTQNLVIGIIQIVLCCGLSIITGILILVWNNQLDGAFRNSDQIEMARLEKNIKITTIIGFIMPVVGWILYFLFFAGLMTSAYYW